MTTRRRTERAPLQVRGDDIPERQRYRQRPIIDYSRVLRDIQLNAWILAYRHPLGDGLRAWQGETTTRAPACAGA